MAQVTIDGNVFEVYASVPQADVFLLGDVVLGAAWATALNQEQALVSATRYIDRQTWQGEQTDPGVQELEWPRTEVTDKYGDPVNDALVPVEIFQASIMLAAMFIQDASLFGEADTGSNTRKIKAGSAEVEFFKPEGGTRFPDAVQDLVGQFLAAAVGVTPPEAFGTDVERTLEDGYGLSRGF